VNANCNFYFALLCYFVLFVTSVVQYRMIWFALDWFVGACRLC
jgi:hypothetical protein